MRFFRSRACGERAISKLGGSLAPPELSEFSIKARGKFCRCKDRAPRCPGRALARPPGPHREHRGWSRIPVCPAQEWQRGVRLCPPFWERAWRPVLGPVLEAQGGCSRERLWGEPAAPRRLSPWYGSGPLPSSGVQQRAEGFPLLERGSPGRFPPEARPPSGCRRPEAARSRPGKNVVFASSEGIAGVQSNGGIHSVAPPHPHRCLRNR